MCLAPLGFLEGVLDSLPDIFPSFNDAPVQHCGVTVICHICARACVNALHWTPACSTQAIEHCRVWRRVKYAYDATEVDALVADGQNHLQTGMGLVPSPAWWPPPSDSGTGASGSGSRAPINVEGCGNLVRSARGQGRAPINVMWRARVHIQGVGVPVFADSAVIILNV